MGTRFDHLVISVADLDDAVARWGRAGLTAQVGGRHPGGTVNALIRGPRAAYIELIGVEDGADSAWAQRARGEQGPLGFAVAVDDLVAARDALIAAGFTPQEITDGSRVTPDGATLRWRLCQVGAQAFDPHLPFLIEWSEPMPPGPADGPVLESLGVDNIDTAHRDRLVAMLRAIGFPEEPTDVPWVTFFDGEVRITLPASQAEMEAWERAAQGRAAYLRVDVAAEDEPGPTPAGPTSVGLGLPGGEFSWVTLDGLGVSSGPDVRSHVGHVLLPAVEAHFAQRPAELATWPAPHPDRAPHEDEYSRCLDPGKYAILGARARAWVAALVEADLASATETDGRIALTPHRPGALPLMVTLEGEDGTEGTLVEVAAGDVVVSRVPVCGCDACDDGSAEVLTALDETFLHILNGGVLHIAGSRGRTVTTALNGWSASGNFRGNTADEWLADARAGRSRHRVTEGEPWLA